MGVLAVCPGASIEDTPQQVVKCGEIVVTAGAFKHSIWVKKSTRLEGRCDRAQSFGMGIEAPIFRRLLDDRGDRRWLDILLPARPKRGSGFHVPNDDRAGRLARSDPR